MAVLDATSVSMAVMRHTMKTMASLGITSKYRSCSPSHTDSPDTFDASAMAKPPPSSRTTPQGIFFCTTSQVMQAGEEVGGAVGKEKPCESGKDGKRES